MPLDFSNLFPQMQGIPQVQTPMTQDVSGGASIGPVPLGVNAGPAGALQQMQQYANANQAFQGNEQAQQLEQANAQNTYENLLKNNPMQDAQRDLAMQQLGVQQNLYKNNPDLMNQQATSGVGAQIAQNYAQAATSQQQEMTQHFKGALAASQLLASGGYNPDPLQDKFDYTDKKAWAAIQAALSAGNVTGIGGDATPADAKRIFAEGQAAVNTAEQLQKLGLGTSEYVHQVGTDNAAKGVGEITVRNQGVIAGMLAQQQVMLGNKLATAPPQEQARYSVTQTISQTGQVTPDLAQKWIAANEMDALSGQGATTFKSRIQSYENAVYGESLADVKADAVRLDLPGANTANWNAEKTKLQFAGPLAIAKATEDLHKEQAKAFRNDFASYPFVTDQGTKRLGDASVDEILHSAMPPGVAGAAATQAVQKNPVNQGTAPITPQPQAPNPLTQQAPVSVGQQPQQPNITINTSTLDAGPKAPPNMSSDQVMTWLLTNPKNHGLPLAEVQKRAIMSELLVPKNATPSQPMSQ